MGSELSEVLRAHDARVTQPRQLVWDVLTQAPTHLSTLEIADRVQAVDAGINMSSVYRALTLFAELDLVRESRLGDDTASTWELRHGDGVIHLVCDSCNRVLHHRTDRVEQMRSDLAQIAQFAISSIDVRVTGTCADCTAPLVDWYSASARTANRPLISCVPPRIDPVSS